ncbi:MAG: BON domain-containing protein [Candidatus Competibacteraceae bacterium]|nr:BON domain-containing protein [Candidatus Competibacteraceae bacterium]
MAHQAISIDKGEPMFPRLLLAAALATLLTVAQGAEPPQRDPDTWQEAALTTTLELNPQLENADLEVTVSDGIATLSGRVDSQVERELALEIARSTRGVREVVDRMTVEEAQPEPQPLVEPEPPQERDFATRVRDATITAAIKSKLLWNRNTSGLDIGVDTVRSRVMLTGQARSEAARNLAGRIAATTDGVVEVNNRIQVDPDMVTTVEKAEAAARVAGERTEAAARVAGEKAEAAAEAAGGVLSDAWITTKVLSSLALSDDVRVNDLNVDSEDGRVILTGLVNSDYERRRAVEIVRDVIGVQEVEDRIEVAP